MARAKHVEAHVSAAEQAVQKDDKITEKDKLPPLWVVGIVLLILLGVAAFISLAYHFVWPWTGFNQNGSTKTLWDWLQLLIVPLVLAGGGYWLNHIQKEREERVAQKRSNHENLLAEDNQHEAALQGYIDKMSEFILKNHFSCSAENDEIRAIVRALTLTVLTHLDPQRKGRLLQFLYDSKLLSVNQSLINLKGADLSRANLSRADLKGANLSGANLSGAILCQANLSGTQLNNVNLCKADLTEALARNADLQGADLRKACLHMIDLREANLHRADLREADLTGADLYETDLVAADLGKADLRGAYMRESELRETNQDGKDAKNLFKLHGTILTETSYNKMVHWPNGFRPDTRALENDGRVLPVFVDFKVHPARLANVILREDDSRFNNDHVELGNNERVVIEFDLEKSDLAKMVVTIFGLVSRQGTRIGNAHINLSLKEEQFISGYTIPGAGFQPRSETFCVPRSMLAPGRNSLKFQIDSAAETYFWLYSLEIRSNDLDSFS